MLCTSSMFQHLVKFQKQFIQSVEDISRSIEIFNKSISKSLDNSIDSQFLFDQSKGISDRSKNWRNSSQSLWMTRSILDSYLIDRKEFSIYRDSWNWIFSNFSGNVFDVSLKQNRVPWSYQNEIEIKTEFHWCYSLKVQYGMVKIKLK